ncbi:hypothetical protein N9W78_01595 [bacterium]|nr:hypothetical protein [bacterium]
MLSILKGFILSPFRADTTRERHLSDQVDRLEMALLKAKRELKASQIRLGIERENNTKHRLRDYPAHELATTISNQSLFGSQFRNPLDDLLSDVAALGYDVTGPMQIQKAQLTLIAQYQDGVAKVIAEASALRDNSEPVTN